ncbi:MAG: DUF4278 domain-containing protein [Leptolyngbyaceae bacterium]|nr:DUF4278 domain-containing protein [Leptolyngbyaceae bacterium]
MRLSYRGVSYSSEPPVLDAPESQVEAKYRGQNYQIQYAYPRHIPVEEATTTLQYRGVAYLPKGRSHGQPVTSSSRHETVVTQSESSLPLPQYRGVAYSGDRKPSAKVSMVLTQASAPTQYYRHKVVDEFVEAHRLNMQRSLERRLQVARERGDEMLISLLEREMQQIA